MHSTRHELGVAALTTAMPRTPPGSAEESTTQVRAVDFTHTSNFASILQQLNISLLVSTYQAGKLISIGSVNGQLDFAFHGFEQVMGVAVANDRLAIGAKRQIYFLNSSPDLAPLIEPAGSYDSCWLSRMSFITGSIHVHDLAWGSQGLWAVNTLFSCLCTLSNQYNFVPQWRPPFISQLIDQDRCHLNGLAMESGQPRYVTVLGESDDAAGWRPTKTTGGALLEVPSGNVLTRGLCMPHSPRLSDGQLWVLNSGRGELGKVDRETGVYQAIAQLPGYTRGLSLAGGLAFVGLSRIRETNIFGGLPIGENPDELRCGVGVIEISTGRTIATLQFKSGVEEIFAVEVIAGSRRPKICGPSLQDDGEKEIWVVPAETTQPALQPLPSAPSTTTARTSVGPAAAREIHEWIAHATQAHQQGRLQEALELLQRAAAAQPNSAEVHNLLGNLFQDLNQQAHAIAHYERAVQLDPEYAPAHQTLGVICAANNQPMEALRHYELAQRQRPSNMNMLLGATMLPIIYDSQEHVDYWRGRLEDSVASLADLGITINTRDMMIPSSFNFAYHGRNDRLVMQNLARVYRGVECCESAKSGSSRPRRQRPRIGFLSAHFCNHTIGRLNVGLIERLPKEKFEIAVISLRRHDDDFSQRFQQAGDHYIVVPRSPEAARQAIASLDLDVLIFADVGMDALTQTLCYSRMAPIQAVTWGHPDTTGSPAMDYFISSHLAEPAEGEQHYSEQLVRLPTLGVYYERPQLSGPNRTRESFGLASDRHLYLCPQTLFKFHPTFDEVLRGILRADPQGEVAVIEGRVPTWTAALRGRWQRTMPDEMPRIRFLPALPQPDYLHLLSLGDAMLDPFPFGGGNTTYEALALGTPVVTLSAEFLRGRLALGMYQRMGYSELIAESPDDYIHRALRLGCEPDFNRQARAAISQTCAILYNNPEDVSAYSTMLDEWTGG